MTHQTAPPSTRTLFHDQHRSTRPAGNRARQRSSGAVMRASLQFVVILVGIATRISACSSGPASVPAQCVGQSAFPPSRPQSVTCAASAGDDQCLTDGDCPTGMACACSNELSGVGAPANTCLAAQCRVDADCGSHYACSPSGSGHCGSVTGLFCHSLRDTCTTNADCCSESSAGACVYQPALGFFACQAPIPCVG
jgi:hypothetical protein